MSMEGEGHSEDHSPTHCLIEEEYTIAVPLVRPKPLFLDLLRLAGATNEVFTRKEILHYLKMYIVSKQMFDLSNPSVVHCQGDLLGEVFGVTQFTISDVLKLLAENCMPLPDAHLQRRRRLVSKPAISSSSSLISTSNDLGSQADCLTSSSVISSTSSNKLSGKHSSLPHTKSRKSSCSSSSCDKVDSTESAVPSSLNQRKDPSIPQSQVQNSAYSAHQGSAAVNCAGSDSSETEKTTGSRKRKRKSSGSSPAESSRRRGTSLSILYGDDGDKTSYPWYFQLELEDRSDNDKSEVLSVQGKETVVVQDSTDDLWFLEEDSVAVEVPSDTEFSIEYDVDSDISPATESDISSVQSGEGFYVVCKESDVEFFADCSDSDSNDGDRELTEADYWCCAECNQSNPPVQRYCGRCWKLRADWLRSHCGLEDKNESKEKKKSENKSVSKVLPEEVTFHINHNILEKEDKCSGFDSGVGSLCSILPSSQETISSDISVFCDTPVEKSVSSHIPTANGASTLLKETQIIESRHSFANIQVKPRSLSCNSVIASDHSSEYVKGHDTSKAPSMALDDPCMICLTQPKTASLIHGTTGHQVCCFPCGKRLKRRGKRCPVCRRPIQKVVRNYIL